MDTKIIEEAIKNGKLSELTNDFYLVPLQKATISVNASNAKKKKHGKATIPVPVIYFNGKEDIRALNEGKNQIFILTIKEK